MCWIESFGEITAGYTGEVRKMGSFIISYFFFDGGGVDIDCSGGFSSVSEDLEVMWLVSICSGWLFVGSIGLRNRIGEVLHEGVVDWSEMFEMFRESSCDWRSLWGVL